MTAAMLVLEPVFEADLPPEQYAYRPGRNAQQAAMEVKDLLFYGHPDVVDADLADYFGSIPNAELMLLLARRIVDARVLQPKGTATAMPDLPSPRHISTLPT
jgi:retron-type reverse transcriptase